MITLVRMIRSTLMLEERMTFYLVGNFPKDNIFQKCWVSFIDISENPIHATYRVFSAFNN